MCLSALEEARRDTGSERFSNKPRHHRESSCVVPPAVTGIHALCHYWVWEALLVV